MIYAPVCLIYRQILQYLGWIIGIWIAVLDSTDCMPTNELWLVLKILPKTIRLQILYKNICV